MIKEVFHEKAAMCSHILPENAMEVLHQKMNEANISHWYNREIRLMSDHYLFEIRDTEDQYQVRITEFDSNGTKQGKETIYCQLPETVIQMIISRR